MTEYFIQYDDECTVKALEISYGRMFSTMDSALEVARFSGKGYRIMKLEVVVNRAESH